MTFGEALLEVLSFFWSPAFVILLLVMGIMAFLVTASIKPGIAIWCVLIDVVLGILLAAVIVYYVNNGSLDPLTWRAS